MAILDKKAEVEGVELPDEVRGCVELILIHIADLQTKIDALEQAIRKRHRANELSQRLATIPGIGVITATALVATVVDASAFKSGRHFAAWIGLVPRQNGTGGKMRLGKISKQGEPYLRRLLVLGATAVVRYAKNKPEFAGWVNALLARRPARVVTVAVANKLARIVWAIMRRGGSFRLSLPETKSGDIGGASHPGLAPAECGRRPGRRATPAHPCSATSAFELDCSSSRKIEEPRKDGARQIQQYGQGSPVGSSR